ncbi:MAG TPA: isoleucine--tRNA ligase [Candidatus Syntrophosphaera sp.]|jgi:isoleucyl-tRNA synthetase|nr:isoleucine--tRNA ligase [Candidatus Syntrophosphaera sp.]HQK29342.1 isoleucine--tRNA ligase [Candidatus Syntrophosphaera sp.]HRQ67251.1 isoleucine--tRNA ligase [Candidatus Syntrophosphaera sp.]
MFKSIDLKENPRHLEERIRAYWREHSLAQKSIDLRKGSPQFVFYEGPPTANGKPGIHHMLSRTLKDLVCRYKTMNGFQVKRKAGWDTHGLPVEIEVERQLGLEDKKAIEDYGVEKFCQACKESVWSYLDLWQEMTELMGYWIDLDDPYITMHNSYIESVWHILDDFFRRGLIYKAHKIVPYCPSCGTPLSSHEVALGYRDVEDPSIFVKFKALDEDGTWYLAWTTTPWTLISNVALVVHPDETYVKVRHLEENYILAKARLETLEGEYEILSEFPGRELERRRYQPLFSFIKPEKPAWYVGLADYVSMDDGTGIVHTAPAFGADDYALGLKYDLPFIQPVDAEGKFNHLIEPWAGIFVKTADKDIIRSLKESGNLYRREQVKHSYPHCWRCENLLIYYARESWYIRTTQFKEQLLEQNRQIDWYPGFVGEKRFGEWLANNVDWALSRDRFWGTPLNIWICEDCGEKSSVGSIGELVKRGKLKDGSSVPEDIELHRPYIDDVKLTCPKCGGGMNRTQEVIDCWFDSGSMPFAQWHYPFENKDTFDSELFPADFISEGIDQTRGWFYSMLAIGTLYKGRSSYKSCLVNDLILDAKGQKMSKSKGNSVDPIELMQTFGADAIRWYLVEISPPWVPTRFDVEGVKEIIGKFIGTLKNTYSFFATYANIDSFDASAHPWNWERSAEIDRWIVSRLQTLIGQVRDWMEDYELTKVVRAIQDFVIDELSNWYVRRSRRRFWALELTEDKINAYRTLYQVLVSVAEMIAPFAPYLAEELYLSLGAGESVHLAAFPQSETEYIDPALEKEMRVIIDIVQLGRAARNACQIKVRQPLQKMYVPAKYRTTLERMFDLIQEEVNIHEIVYVSEDEDFVRYELKPQFKVMGPKYGNRMKAIASELARVKGQEVLKAFNYTGSYKLAALDIDLVPEDVAVHIQPREGFVFESMKDMFVALDTALTPELIREGYARELVNKIQFSRKEQGFEIMDRIMVEWIGDDEIKAALDAHGEFIQSETLCDELSEAASTEGLVEYDINGKQVWMRITRTV